MRQRSTEEEMCYRHFASPHVYRTVHTNTNKRTMAKKRAQSGTQVAGFQGMLRLRSTLAHMKLAFSQFASKIQQRGSHLDIVH